MEARLRTLITGGTLSCNPPPLHQAPWQTCQTVSVPAHSTFVFNALTRQAERQATHLSNEPTSFENRGEFVSFCSRCAQVHCRSKACLAFLLTLVTVWISHRQAAHAITARYQVAHLM